MKVSFTLSAKKLLNEIKEVHGDDLLFHQSGGCCDGSAPMCFPAKEYQVGNSDVKLGEVDGTPFYMNEDQYEKWKHTDCLLYTSPSPRDSCASRMPSSA